MREILAVMLLTGFLVLLAEYPTAFRGIQPTASELLAGRDTKPPTVAPHRHSEIEIVPTIDPRAGMGHGVYGDCYYIECQRSL